MTFDHFAKDLGKLESFDEKVFIGDDKVSQNVCDLILALAVAYNDFRDVFFAHVVVDQVGVIPKSPITAKLGLRNGIKNTIIRVQIGFVHEILNLLKDNALVLYDPAFKYIVKQLSKNGKVSLNALITVALDKPSKDPLVRALLLIRNKIAFHYDAAEIGRSYKESFLKNKKYGTPIVSRGAYMKNVRFYFADAVSQNYIASIAKDKIAFDFLNGDGKFLIDMNRSMYEIIERFIQSRSSWRQL